MLKLYIPSIEQCLCHPWNYPEPVDKQIPLCTYFGNECFHSKFANSSHRLQNCNCLPGCNEVEYKYVIDSNRKFTDEEADKLCGPNKPHFNYILNGIFATFPFYQIKNNSLTQFEQVRSQCLNYIKNEYSRVTVRIGGSSFLRRVQSLSYTTSDKLGAIGGTLGLFSGFSFLVIFEIFHWAILTVKKAFWKSSAMVEPKISNDITIVSVAQDSMKKEIENMKKENNSMKKEIENIKKENTELRKMIDGNEAAKKTMTVINIE